MSHFAQSHDFISIYDGHQNIYNQSGIIHPRNIQSSSSNMTIHFTSGDKVEDDNGTDNRFAIDIKFILPGKAGIQLKRYCKHRKYN